MKAVTGGSGPTHVSCAPCLLRNQFLEVVLRLEKCPFIEIAPIILIIITMYFLPYSGSFRIAILKLDLI